MKRLFSATAVATLLLVMPALAQQPSQPARQPQERRVPKPAAAQPATPGPAQAAPEQASPGSLGAPAGGLPDGAKPFGNWVYSCSSQTVANGKPVKSCNLRTSLVVEDAETKQQSVVATVAIARTVGEKQTQLIMQLPLSALLLLRPRILTSDGKPIAELAWVACNQQMCISSVTLTDVQFSLLQKLGDTLSVVFRNQAGQDIKIDGSSKGIVEGLNALVQEK